MPRTVRFAMHVGRLACLALPVLVLAGPRKAVPASFRVFVRLLCYDVCQKHQKNLKLQPQLQVAATCCATVRNPSP